jgi:hypothetical protein
MRITVNRMADPTVTWQNCQLVIYILPKKVRIKKMLNDLAFANL